MESACQQSSNCHLMVDSAGRKMMVREEGKEYCSDNRMKDRGRTLGVACLAVLGSVWTERV